MRVRLALILVGLAVVVAVAANLPAEVARAQGGNGITSPTDNQVVRGSVQIVGTATLPDFLRYELYFSSNEQDWVYFSGGNVPVIGGVLGYWDTVGANLPDGRYSLRMRVVRTDSNYDEYFVHWLTVANSAPPTAEASATSDVTQPPTDTPVPAGSTPSGTVEVTVELPAVRNTATPTPTRLASARATSSSGLPDFSRLGSGAMSNFMLGVQCTAVAFVLIGGYVFLRNGTFWTARQLRRILTRRRRRGEQR